MDPSFFGLDGHPFDSTSDADETYLAETHTSLIAELKAGLKAPHGITLLIGEEGTGKTTLIRRFGEACGESCTVAYLPTTGPGLRHLLTETIEQLGGTPPAAEEEQALLDCLTSLARARAEHGRTTLVLVDDAHELPAKTIERVGRLFGDDPAEPTMLHVVLVGRSELLDRMNAANDRTILKHLVQVCRMDPIGPEESFRYIADRIAKVGGVVDKLFTEDALRLIVKKANGNPGRIDAICSAALEQAAESGESAVGADIVDLACMGVEGFSIDAPNGKPAEKDPMQYIFGEDELDDGDARVARRLREGANGTKDHANNETGPPVGKVPNVAGTATALAGAASAFRQRLAEVTDNRRRLSLWAIGLVAVLVAFSAAMTRTDEPELPQPTKVAEAPAVAEPTENRSPLPATAVRTSKLVVKRDGGAQTEPASATGSPEPAPEAAASRPHVEEAPAHEPPAPSVAATVSAAQPQPEPKPQGPLAPVAAPTAGTASAAAAPAPIPAAAPGASAPAGASATTTATASAAAAPPTPAPSSAPTSAPASASSPTKAPAVALPVKEPPAQVASEPKPQPAAKPAEKKPVVVAAAAPPKPATTQAASLASANSASAAPQSAGTGKYTVQIGSFKSRENAEALLAKVQRSYPDGRVIETQSSGAAVYRVVSGAFASKHDADSRARMLAENGYPTFIRDMP